MVGENFCYNCFQERDSLDGPCPHCGFDLVENEKKYPVALRAGTVLNGRYIVGRVLGQAASASPIWPGTPSWRPRWPSRSSCPENWPLAWRAPPSLSSPPTVPRILRTARAVPGGGRTLAKFIGNPNIAAVTSYFDENDTRTSSWTTSRHLL